MIIKMTSIGILVCFIFCIHLTLAGQQFVTVQPNQIVAKPGSNASFICKVDYPIAFCRITIPGHEAYSLYPNNDINGVTYFGQGLDKGECGATITNIQDANNGEVSCNIPPDSGAVERSGKMKLVVAKAPEDLEFSPNANIKEGDEVTLNCSAIGGKSTANISLFLDGKILKTGQSSIKHKQKFSHKDHLRHLTCISDHMMTQKQIKTKILNIMYAPKAEIFYAMYGEMLMINITVEGNPRPGLFWKLKNSKPVLFNESTNEINEITIMGSLTISNVTNEYTHFILFAKNSIGNCTIDVYVKGFDKTTKKSTATTILSTILSKDIATTSTSTSSHKFSVTVSNRSMATSNDIVGFFFILSLGFYVAFNP